MRETSRCDVCTNNKEEVKLFRAKYGTKKMYFACPKCQEEMLHTARLLDLNHKKAVLSGEFEQRSGSLALIHCE